ncbi:ComEC family competence protein, partial [Flavobacterium jejuense]|nr:ComEC family competence protein [Flavobacterium jejuense]
FQGKRILIVDSSSVYVNNEKPDLVLLSQSPKLNLVRFIADNSNSFYLVNQWEVTCKQEKIPFHATAEKGFYRL